MPCCDRNADNMPCDCLRPTQLAEPDFQGPIDEAPAQSEGFIVDVWPLLRAADNYVRQQLPGAHLVENLARALRESEEKRHAAMSLVVDSVRAYRRGRQARTESETQATMRATWLDRMMNDEDL